jgi:RHS repeat-associated protein
VHANASYDTFVRDGLGSVRLEVSGTGAITSNFDYLAYGSLNAATQTPLIGFAGELHDPSGLIYLRARWYDPGVGRLTVADRFLGTATEPHSLNLYAYAAANPVNRTDPSGNCIACILGGALIGGIANTAGYVASLAITHQQFAWDQAAIAFGTGAVAGAVCTATLFGACAFTNVAATVVQYGLAPGQKSLEGYVAAAVVGLATSPLVFTPFRAPVGDGSRFVYSLTRLKWAERGQIQSGLASFTRSLFASGIATGTTTVFGTEQTLVPGAPVSVDVPLSK